VTSRLGTGTAKPLFTAWLIGGKFKWGGLVGFGDGAVKRGGG